MTNETSVKPDTNPSVATTGDTCSMNNGWIKTGGLFAALAAVLGMIGPYGLSQVFSQQHGGQTLEAFGQQLPATARYMQVFLNATLYQLIHGLAIVVTGILMTIRPRLMLKVAAWLFFAGILTYCGLQYAFALTGLAVLETTSLMGGVLFLLGWLALVEGGCPGACK